MEASTVFINDVLKLIDDNKYKVEFKDFILNKLSYLEHKLFFCGNISNRILILITRNNALVFYIDDFNDTALFIKYNDCITNKVILHDSVISYTITNYSRLLYKLTKPYVNLIALYHKENFPLPRFALGISDIAGAIRKNNLGTVSLTDMQLDFSLKDIISRIKQEHPEIIGISSTFGQQDLLEEAIYKINAIQNYKPLIIVGGSLSVLNYKLLLNMFPTIVVALGYGETTMQNIVEYWHGFINIDQVNHIAYSKNGTIIETPKRVEDKLNYAEPELDLLLPTLERKGVLQLESSRGCTYACSFCPRGHKGKWVGSSAKNLDAILIHINEIYNMFPNITRKVFLVDEEFIGYKFEGGVQERTLHVAQKLQKYNFKFETSTRIDQIYRPQFDYKWHIERIDFWKALVSSGLSRILFGMESGVDTILKRFNKKTSATQNGIGIRLLTLTGVPIRLSYIMFDPLMSMEELIKSYYYIGRKDILLKNSCQLSSEEIYKTAFNEQLVKQFALGEPLYSKISYMLVSMESLMGSKYLEMVQKEHLTTTVNKSMGRINTNYKDSRIGIMSNMSQRWVDKNFSLDYLLKSILKISTDTTNKEIYMLREIIKTSAYQLLGKMLSIVNNDICFVADFIEVNEKNNLLILMNKWEENHAVRNDVFMNSFFLELMDDHFESLNTQFYKTFTAIKDKLPNSVIKMLEDEIKKWYKETSWELINND